MPSSQPSIDVTEKARAHLRAALARAPDAGVIGIDVGRG